MKKSIQNAIINLRNKGISRFPALRRRKERTERNEIGLNFTKMQALGNDYIYVELLTQRMENPSAWARFLSRRRFGVGSDGMILICPSAKADFRMRVFNPDGSEAEMCGNALRSTAKLVYEKGFTSKTAFTVETLGGIKELFLTLEDGHVSMITASLGAPILESARVPVTLDGGDGRCIDRPVEAAGRLFRITAVSMGNPHCATFADDAAELDLPLYGAAIETHPVFPQKANVEFVRVIDENTLFMRTWERNCGETLACGTGCCVATVAGVLTGRCAPKTAVRQLGGVIHIEWDRAADNLLMTGPSEIVFDGTADERAAQAFFDSERRAEAGGKDRESV